MSEPRKPTVTITTTAANVSDLRTRIVSPEAMGEAAARGVSRGLSSVVQRLMKGTEE